MTANVEEIIKLVCPLCEKPLANEEYHKALQKSEIQAKEKSEKDEENRRIIHNKERSFIRHCLQLQECPDGVHTVLKS